MYYIGIKKYEQLHVKYICICNIIIIYKIEHDKIDIIYIYTEIVHQVHTRSAERLRAMCCKNGGCFIKVGQHIGALEYLLPKEYVQTMQVLHSKAPHTHIRDIYATIEQTFNCKVYRHLPCEGWDNSNYTTVVLSESQKPSPL